MRKIFIIVFVLVTLLLFGVSLIYLYKKNRMNPRLYSTEQASFKDITNKIVISGSIYSSKEVSIKPNISGIIEEIFVKEGEVVQKGMTIAKIKIVPNTIEINEIKADVQDLRIILEDRTRTLDRNQRLYNRGVISKVEFDHSVVNQQRAKLAYDSAVEKYELVKTGATKNNGSESNTLIKSTIDGTILQLPVKVGDQVIESNNFYEGTTIAEVGDLSNMIFEGKIDESDVAKVVEGLPMEITIGALGDHTFKGRLNYISPKGILDEGTRQFNVLGSISNSSHFIRSGLSANASIILDKVSNVMAINEALIQYDDKTQKPFVEIETGNQQFKKQEIKLGISDGIFTEVKSGINLEDKIQVWY